MIDLRSVRDYLKTQGVAEHYYIGKLNSKKEKSVGVYYLNKRNEYARAVGEERNDRAGSKPASILIHWNKNAAETEEAAWRVFEFLRDTQPKTQIGNHEISFIQMLQNEPVDVSTDDFGIYERVIEIIIHYIKN